MEWVETTGRTVDEAKDAALDQLGVDEADAEFEVVEEPRSGLFGRLRTEARVRARVRPTSPRPKAERRDRRRRAAGGGRTREEGDGSPAGPAEAGSVVVTEEAPREALGDQAGGPRKRRRGGRGRGTRQRAAEEPTNEDKETGMEADGLSLGEQAEVASEFLEGLLDAFGLDGSVETTEVDDETVEVAVAGADLGLLIGPRGQTLTAVQELARTVVQRQQAAPPTGRLRIDIAGYRQRRRAALERFTTEVAAQVRETGTPRALEPMSPPDRKVVHDTANTLDGVTTRSEGEEPYRRVVIVPDGTPT